MYFMLQYNTEKYYSYCYQCTAEYKYLRNVWCDEDNETISRVVIVFTSDMYYLAQLFINAVIERDEA